MARPERSAKSPPPMDSDRYVVRPFRDPDYATYARLRARLGSARRLTTEELRHRMEAYLAPGSVRCWYVVDERAGATPVAWAALDQRSENFHPRKFWANVLVDPDHQGRGIGRTLSALLEREAKARAAVAIWADVRADSARSLEFFHRQGYHELRRRRLSRLDLSAVDPSRVPDRSGMLRPLGIEITTLSDEGVDRYDVRRKCYELVASSGADVPAVGERRGPSFEEFVRADLEVPGFWPEGSFVAKTPSEYVGLTSLERSAADPESVHVGYTGTSPSFRRLGIATELKRRAIELARAQGYRWMDTGNDFANAAIWAINERLGFRTIEVHITGEKHLPATE